MSLSDHDAAQLREIMRELRFIGVALVMIWGTLIVMWYWR